MKNLKNIFNLCWIIAFIIGILLAYNQVFFPISITWITLFILLFLSIIYFKKNIPFWLIACLFFIGFGNVLFQLQNQKPIVNLATNNPHLLQIEIKNSWKSSKKYKKYEAELISIKFNDQNYKVHSKLLVSVTNDKPKLFPGDIIWVNAKINPLPKLLNPYGFDYGEYLSKKHIQNVIYTKNYHLSNTNHHNLFYHFAKLKDDLSARLLQQGYSKDVVDLIGALILGDRTDINELINENYRKAGVVHILSISGLHVWLIFQMIYWLLLPFRRIGLSKKNIFLICMLVIWAYAIFVQLVPAVSRSALMISFYCIGMAINRPQILIHTLSMSAFLILIFNTNYLFDIGFQLSFSAVFFIYWLNPIFKFLIIKKNAFFTYFTEIIASSFSAQLGTLPITLYYFHGTSTVFLLGNLILVPASFLMILGGIISLIFAYFGINFKIWITIYNGFNDIINQSIDWIAHLKFSILEEIPLDFLGMVVLMFILLLMPRKKSEIKQKLMPITILILFFQFHRYYQTSKHLKKEGFYVFHQYKNTVFAIRKSGNLDVYYSDFSQLEALKKFVIKPFQVHEHLQKIKYYPIDTENTTFYVKTKNLIAYKGKKILITNHEVSKIQDFDYIILRNSPKWQNMETLQKKRIIADGSNYPKWLYNLSSTIQQDSLLWITNSKGAFVTEF